MKHSFACLLAGLVLTVSSVFAQTAGPARVTLTVTQFRSLTSGTDDSRWTDANVSLAPHSAVTLIGNGGPSALATFKVRGAVAFEINVVSAAPAERYTVLGVTFEQKPDAQGRKSDPKGRLNFGPATVAGATLKFPHLAHAKSIGRSYEFFVVVQRASDGAIGVIDPAIENTQE